MLLDKEDILNILKSANDQLLENHVLILERYDDYISLDRNQLFQLSSILLRNSKLKKALNVSEYIKESFGELKFKEKMLLGNIYFRLSKYNQAKEIFAEINTQKDNLRNKYILSKCHFELGDLIEAESLIESEISLSEGKPRWYFLHEINLKQKLGKYRVALDLAKRAISIFPNDETILGKVYSFHYMLGELGKALESLNAIIELNPENVRMRCFRAQHYLNMSKYSLAEEDFMRIMEIEEYIPAMIGLAEISMNKGDFDNAKDLSIRALDKASDTNDVLKCVELIVKIDPERDIDTVLDTYDQKRFDSEDFKILSSIRTNQKKFDKAIQAMEQAILLDTAKLDYKLELARIFIEQGDFNRAEFEIINNGLLESSISFHARYMFCRLARLKKNRHLSLQRFRDFNALYPQNFNVKRELVFELTQLSKFLEAEDILREELNENPDNSEAFKLLIKSYLTQQDFNIVIKLLDDYERVHSSLIDSEIISLRIRALREMGEYGTCLDLITESLTQTPDSYTLNMEMALLNRSLGYLNFFERYSYNTKALDLHKKMLLLYPQYNRFINQEIIQDLILLNKFNEALDLCNDCITKDPAQINYYILKFKILNTKGAQEEAIRFIENTLDLFPDEQQLWFLKCESLVKNGSFQEAEKELNQLLSSNPSHIDALKLLVKVSLAMKDFDKADTYIKTGLSISSSALFKENIISDYYLLKKHSRKSIEGTLGIEEHPEDSRLTRIDLLNSFEARTCELEEPVVVSQIVIESDITPTEAIFEYTQNRVDWIRFPEPIQLENNKLLFRFVDQAIISIRHCESVYFDNIYLFTYYPTSTNIVYKDNLDRPWKDYSFSVRIVNTGLGDQFHYLRTTAILAESLGMKFGGFLEEDLTMIRERVTENPYLYQDLGFSENLVDESKYEIIDVSLKDSTSLITGFLKWRSFQKLLFDINLRISKSLENAETLKGKLIKKPLFVFKVDDHTFSRIIARQFYSHIEPNTFFRELVAKNFLKAKGDRGEFIVDSGRIKLVLQCRLGDVANIPIQINDVEYILIPFSGEVFQAKRFDKSHQRFSDLEKIMRLGNKLKDTFKDELDICFMTDGYDYGIDYLLKYKQNLLEEFGINEEKLTELKSVLEYELKAKFAFADTILYGESYDNLIASLDNIESAKLIFSSNGQFSSEFKMSVVERAEPVFIAKKLYANLRVKLNQKSTDIFWDMEGSEESILDEACNFIRNLQSEHTRIK